MKKLCLVLLLMVSCNRYLQEELHTCFENDNATKLQEILQQGVSPDYELQGKSLLEHACEQNKIEMTSILLHVGAKTSGCIGATCDSPLMVAALEGYDEIVSLLILHKADVDAQNNLNQTPLMFAAMNAHQGICESLLESGAQPELEDKWGKTAMFYAVNQNAGIVESLLEYGASPVVSDRHGYTPIVYACIRPAADTEQVKIVKILLHAGAKFEKRTFEGVDLVSIAKSNENVKLAMFLQDYLDCH